MANLTAYKDTGELLFDTNLICYGLVKSGYMAYQQSWTRRTLKSAQLDPSDPSNLSPVVVNYSQDAGDNLWGFTVYNAISPITFITGPGCLVGTSLSGSAMTFLYTNASPSTKFYCFDLMADTIGGSTYLKTWDSSGRITFNSLQPPLNVVAAVQAPGPGSLDTHGRYTQCYSGGSWRYWRPAYNYPGSESYIDIALGSGEFAAYLPWSRSAGVYDVQPNYPASGPFYFYNASEGAYGRNGGITFTMASTAGGSYIQLSGNQFTVPLSWINLPVDRFPTALVINTAGYQFPYN
jgi:hypothetical protein